ncbi:hypothetical protein KIPB_009574, partial [Kipferlia bialata]
PLSIPDHLPQHGPIRYIDVRPPPERLKYIPKSSGKPCLSLRSTYSKSVPQIFLEPDDVAVAMAIRHIEPDSDTLDDVDDMSEAEWDSDGRASDEEDSFSSIDSDLREDSDREEERAAARQRVRERERERRHRSKRVQSDTPEEAIMKYLSMSFTQAGRDGLRSVVSAAFGTYEDHADGEALHYGEGEGLLSGEGVYAAKWIASVLALKTNHYVWIQSECPRIAKAVVEAAAVMAEHEIEYLPHHASEVRVGKGVWKVVDMSFDRAGNAFGKVEETATAKIAMLGKAASKEHTVFISPSLPKHTLFRCHTLRTTLTMLDTPTAVKTALEV